jgi:hypothetical protein
MLDYMASGCNTVPSGYMKTESGGLTTTNDSEIFGAEMDETDNGDEGDLVLLQLHNHLFLNR